MWGKMERISTKTGKFNAVGRYQCEILSAPGLEQHTLTNHRKLGWWNGLPGSKGHLSRMMQLGFFQNKFVFVSICLYLPVLPRLDLYVITVPGHFVNWHSFTQDTAKCCFFPQRHFHIREGLQELQAPPCRLKSVIKASVTETIRRFCEYLCWSSEQPGLGEQGDH